MPLIEVKLFEDELTQDQTKELIQKITDAVTTTISEKLRDVTWVIVNEVKSGDWGIGGKPLGLADIRKLINS
jgi:4-oxalocrotonate tautomerase